MQRLIANKKMNKKYFLFRIFLFSFLVGMFLWGFFQSSDVICFNQKTFDTLESGWKQTIDGEEIELASIQDYIPMETGDAIVISREITEEMLEKSLFFYAENQEITITIGEEEVYNLTCPEYLEFFESPGRSWVNVVICEADLGETICISLSSPFSIYHILPQNIYSVNASDIYSIQADYLWARNTLSFIVLALALIFYTHAFLWKKHELRRFLLTMADLFLFIGFWMCAQLNMFAVWTGKTALLTIASMILARILPVICYHFISSMLPCSTWRTKLAGILVWGNFALSLILQFVFGISLISTYELNLIIIIISSILGMIEIISYYKKRRWHNTGDYLLYGAILILLAFLTECFVACDYAKYGQYIGMPLALSCIAYAIIVHIVLTKDNVDLKIKQYHLEQEYFKIHKKPLNQEINAHFLYNSLNAVSAYCKEDPEKADLTVQAIAKYMRAYMYLVAANEYVSLEEEEELIYKYIEIQNMRFECCIDFRVDNACNEVFLPPLTLQPLVENAINHGIREKINSGKIEIVACEKNGYAEITVRDNGRGFESKESNENRGVGLKNLEARIHAMGGNMIIISAINKGTEVILQLPFLDADVGE